MKKISGKAESPGRKHPILYSSSGKNLGDTSGYAVHTITLKPVSVKTVLLIPTVQGCSAPGANIRDRIKKQGCLCESCELFRKFQLEGEYFCLQNEKPEFSEEKPDVFMKNCRMSPECDGKIRFCVVEESKT